MNDKDAFLGDETSSSSNVDAAVFRRVFVDTLLQLGLDHAKCDCHRCGRLRHMLGLLGVDVPRWEVSEKITDVDFLEDVWRDGGVAWERTFTLRVLLHEVRAYLEDVPRALEGFKEVPFEVSDLLWKDGWGHLMNAVGEAWSWGRRMHDQDPWVVGARRAFIDALAVVAIPDESIYAGDISKWMMQASRVRSEEAEIALDSLRQRFKKLGMTSPRIPEPVSRHVRLGPSGGIVTSGVAIEEIAGYGLELAANHHNIPYDYLVEDQPNYFISHGRGNGYSSMWGLVARGGGLFASIQNVIWNADLRPGRSDPSDGALAKGVSRVMEAFNELLVPILERGTRPLSVGVVFSTYRRDALVVAKTGSWRGTSNPRVQLPPGWSCVLDLADRFEDDESEIDEAVMVARRTMGSDMEVEPVIQFLVRCMR